MKTLTVIVALLVVWNGVLTFLMMQNRQRVSEHYEIEDVRQGIDQMRDLCFRAPIVMRSAANDVLGPARGVLEIKQAHGSVARDQHGNTRTIGYVFELPESTTEPEIDRVLSTFKYHSGLMLGLDAPDQWPLEMKAGNSHLTLAIPKPDRKGKRLFLDVSFRFSPYVEVE